MAERLHRPDHSDRDRGDNDRDDAHRDDAHRDDNENVHTNRPPYGDELRHQSANTRDTFSAGDLVVQPATWGTAVFVVAATHANTDRTIQVGLATRGADGRIRIDRGIGGAAVPSTLVRVCEHCLNLDPLGHHMLSCDTAAPHASETDSTAAKACIPVVVTDASGGREAVLHVDAETNDAIVVLHVAGHDLVRVDLAAGVVHVRVGDHQDDRMWASVSRFTLSVPQVGSAPTLTAIQGHAAVLTPAGRTVDDHAVTISAGADQTLVEVDSAQEIVNRARSLYLNALRAAGRANEADLVQHLNQRTYDPEAPEDESGAEHVVDLYGLSIGVLPTRAGLRIDINTDEVLSDYGPVLVEVDGYDAGAFRELPHASH